MDSKPSNTGTHRFIEGESYPFRVINIISLPETDEEYYVLEAFSGKRILLKALYYRHYNLKSGQELLCRIDRVNCNGKIYIEPRHPYYRAGELYEFDFIREDIIYTPSGDKKNVIVVKDIYNNEINCICRDKFFQTSESGKVRCRIEQIKKGRLLLVHPEISSENELLNEGMTYRFKIVDTDVMIDGEEYHILSGPFNELHIIRKENYEEYGLEKGQFINCIVDKVGSQGKYLIEPEHPYYKRDGIYDFVYLRKDALETTYGEKEEVLVVQDIYCKENYVFFQQEDMPGISAGSTLKCRVDRLRRGRLHLSLHDALRKK